MKSLTVLCPAQQPCFVAKVMTLLEETKKEFNLTDDQAPEYLRDVYGHLYQALRI